MSSTVGSRSGSGSKKYVDFDELVAIQLEKARTGIRGNDLLMGAVGLGVFLAAYLFVFLVLDHWVFAEGVGQTLRIVLWLGVVAAVVAWIAWKVAIPYLQRVTSLFAAKEIEQTHPGLKSSLLTLVDLRQAGRPVSPQILQAIEKRAAVSLSEMDIDHAIDRRSLMRWSYILLGIVALICVYTMLTPKRLGPSLLRALIPVADIAVGTQTRIEKVTPGDVTVLSRSQVTIETQLMGRIPPEVKVLYSTDDRRFVDEPLVLNDTGESLNRFRGTLTGERGKGLLQGLTYRVVAGDAISPRYTITVTQPPSAAIQDVAYDYPAYMGLEDRTQANPTIDAWEGTAITLRAVANRPVTIARVLFSDSEDTSIKAEEIAMKIEDGVQLSATWPLQFRSDGTYPHFYRIHVETADGSRDPQPTLFPLKIRQDLAPTVQIVHPTADVSAPANGSVQVAWQAADPDFQLANVLIRYEQKGQELVEVDPLFESPPHQATAKGVSAIDLKRFDVRPGDKLTFWLEARDNLQPFGNRQPNVAKTPRININIVDPVDEQQAEKGAQQEKQQAQEKLDQAPPPPQENRANPDEGQPQPEDQNKKPQEGDPKQGAEGNQGDPMQDKGAGDPQNMSEGGMGDPQSGDPQQGTGERRDPPMGNDPKQGPKDPGKGNGQPQRGTPQEQSPEQPQNPGDPMMGEGQEKEGATGNQGGTKPGKTGTGQKKPMSQPQREPQPGGSEAESNPQEQDPEREGSTGGAGQKDKSKGAGQQRGKPQSGGGERQDKASDDEALDRLLKYNEDNPSEPRSEPEPPRENESPSNPSRGSSGRSPMSDMNPGEKPEAGPMNEPGSSPMGMPPRTDKGNDAGGKSPSGTDSTGREKPSDDNTEKGTSEKPTPDGTDRKAPAKDPNEKGPNEKGPNEKGTGGASSDKGMNEPGSKKPGAPGNMPEPTAGEAGNKGPMNGGPMERAMPEKGRPGSEDPAGTKPMPGAGQDNMGPDKAPGNENPNNKPPMGNPDGTGSAPKPGMNEPKPGEGAGTKPQSGPKGTSGAEKNMGGTPKPMAGEPGGAKPNETDPGKPDPTSQPGPGQGMGEKGEMKNTPKPEGGTGAKPRDNADPMKGTGAKPPKTGEAGGGEPGKEMDPMAPMNGRGNDEGAGTKPRTGEKPKAGEGRAGGEKTGDTKPVQRQPNPMGGTEDEPSAEKSDPRTQQSQDPMKGMSGQSADASEGNAGGNQKGPGDTTKRPGKDGSGQPSGESTDPKTPKAPNSKGTPGSGEKSDDPMQGTGTRPGGNQEGMGGEKTEDSGAGGKPMSSATGKETTPEGGAKGSDAGAKPNKMPGGTDEGAEGGEKPMPSGDAGSEAEGGSKEQPGGQPGRKPSEGDRKPGGEDPKSGGKPGGNKGEGPMQGGAPKPGGDNPMEGGGEKPGDMAGGENGGGDPMGAGKPGGKPGGQPGGKPSGNEPGMGGGGPGGEAPPEGKRTEATQPGQGDEGTDLENKKKAVNLMLKRLQDELRRGETDPELLKELGFNESELQQFLKRVDQQLNSEDTTAEAVARRRQFEEFLKGLDADSSGETRSGGDGPREATGGFGARNSVPPSEYAREAEAYKKRLQKKPGARPATRTP